MNQKVCVNGRLSRLLFAARLSFLLIGLAFLSLDATARPQSDQNKCRAAMVSDGATEQTPLFVKMSDLEKDPESYYGKYVTTEGELHRIFTENAFTIEDGGFFKDHDILVISTVPMAEAVSIVDEDDELESGEDVTVTGIVQPYDRGKLECAYGPLHLENREGHSFTKNPVLIIDRTKTAKLEPPVELEKPAPMPEPIPVPEPPKEETVILLPPPPPPPAPEPPTLPRTAGNLPLLALTALLALSGSLLKYRR